MNWQIESEDQLQKLAHAILERFPKERVFLLIGEMGSGKTTLIKQICTALGVVSAMGSPSFSVVNEYFSPERGKIFHFDLYRVKSDRELAELGFSEYLESGHYCFIEWPDLGKDFYDDFLVVQILMQGEVRRIIVSKDVNYEST